MQTADREEPFRHRVVQFRDAITDNDKIGGANVRMPKRKRLP